MSRAEEDHRQAIELLASDAVLAWPLPAPPDVPAERVEELRRVFVAMTEDRDFLTDAAQQQMDVDPVPGATLQALVDRLSATPAETIALVERAITAQ